jgi:hypothetical protein
MVLCVLCDKYVNQGKDTQTYKGLGKHQSGSKCQAAFGSMFLAQQLIFTELTTYRAHT